ncbi:FHA domain-containing protein [Nocardioides ganghwensis]|uniref:FHA domain-containing protein n=1 Tax=Nocardioides ganghwensis TaxID=252230 RepID=A0A4Q2SHE1_9ACTN|nr:FHA domain-containing protein [Nocardioides ganghwensis]MBD3944532.1 FHA domain-containing protein [Nocardioides ganghwensis]RYC04291.1 FHA domain-containing protein [Nocardioides ganghwensis]
MSTEARFAAGDWYAVVGDRATVLLPGSQRGRVATLWDLADSGASADALLDALLADGLSSLDHFALVAHGDDRTRLLVRGAPTAAVSSAGGDELVSADPGTAWAERLVAGVSSIRVTLTGDAAAEHLLAPGLARVSVVEFGTPAPAAEQATEDVAPALVAEAEAEPEPAVTPEPEPEPQPEPEPEPVAAADPVPEAPAAAPMQFGEPADDPTPTGETPAVADDWSDRDGQTQVGAPAPDFDRPPVPGQEMAPEVVSQPVAALVFSTGDVVAVDRTVLVGRAPEARRFASHDQPHVVTVPSPHQEISSTHLEIRPGAGADHGSAIATDLGSTNGTVLALPGLDVEELKPGIAVSLVPGAVLDLGDGVTIQVTNP